LSAAQSGVNAERFELLASPEHTQEMRAARLTSACVRPGVGWRARWVALLILTSGPLAHAALITASNTSVAAVEAAINAAADGDTVMVPAGTATWSSELILHAKAIKLLGAGIDKTVITFGLPDNTQMIDVAGPTNRSVTISGFTFNDSGTIQHYAGLINAAGANWRICSNKFSNLQYNGVATRGMASGVIDHCIFVAPSDTGSANGVSMVGDSSASGPGSSWTTPPAFGSGNYVYIEDCTFDFAYVGNGAYDAYGGARYVFRHNNVTNTWLNHHGCDTGGYRSTHSYEIYNNTLTSTKNLTWFFEFRGGTGVIFSNECHTSFSVGNQIVLDNYRSAIGYFGDLLSPWGYVTGSNPYDGNTDGTGYPALDQIGRTSPTTFTGSNSIQPASPLYCWSNNFNGTPMMAAVDVLVNSTPSVTNHLQANRDFFNNTPRPNYIPFTYPHPLVGTPATANLPPVILLRAPATVPNGAPVVFSAAASYDPEGVLLTYNWSFGDGAVSTDQNPSHAYQTNGSYKARLDVSDGMNTATTNLSITVR
jgi:hypothetical protein